MQILRRIALGSLLVGASLGGSYLSAATAAASSSGITSPIVEPAAGYGFVVAHLGQAKRTIDMSIYELQDSAVVSSLVSRAHSGVVVRVILDSAYSGKYVNQSAFKQLAAGGVKVIWAPAATIFHAKYFVIDGTTAFIGTGNLTSKWYASTRDYWVSTTNAQDVGAISSVFGSDFAGRSANLSKGSGALVWSPGSTSTLVNLIASAKKTVLVESQEMGSSTIERALLASAARGVNVQVAMTYNSSWTGAWTRLKSGGVHVRVLSSSQVYIHAKAICVDGHQLFVGSENFSTSSLSYNRELGVLTTTSAVISPIAGTMQSDFNSGRAW